MILTCTSCGAGNRVPAERLGDRPRCGRCKTALAAEAPVSVGTTEEFAEIVRQSPVPVLVDFWAPWCGPCRVVAPELEKLAKRRRGEVLVVKVDTQALPALGARHDIQSIPTFVRFDHGRETQRVSGAMPAPQLERALGL
ncbi:MAG: thioredoxin TrxC [Sandaracinaceae bacterium]|nr:thioredoxin TrxC [Sandaracinaceae bacterium]